MLASICGAPAPDIAGVSATDGDRFAEGGTVEVHAVGSRGGAFVGGDQVGDDALIEAVAQAPWTFALGLGARTGLVRAAV